MSGGFVPNTELHAADLNNLMANTAEVTFPTRALGSVYTNSSTQPIFCIVTVTSASSGSSLLLMYVGSWKQMVGFSNVGVKAYSFIVPPGISYTIEAFGDATLQHWSETSIG